MNQLNSNNDYFTSWSEIEDSLDQIEGLSSVEIEAAKRASMSAEHFLGDIVFKKQKLPHPLVEILYVNSAPWTRRWLIWFDEMLIQFTQCKGFLSLIHSLRQTNRFWDAVFVLETAQKLDLPGSILCFEDNPDKGNTKQADIQLSIEDDVIHIELTTCGPSEQESKTMCTFNKIISRILIQKAIGLHHAGRLHRRLSEQHLQEVEYAFEGIIDEAIERGFKSEDKPYVFQFAVSTDMELDKLKYWAKERELEINGFDGPSWQVNELARVRNKLRWKARGGQIPKEEPGLVVIRSSRALAPNSNLYEVVFNLEEEIAEYPNLIGVVIVGGYRGSGEEASYRGSNSCFSSKQKPDLRVEYVLCVPNRYFEGNLSDSTRLSALSCFGYEEDQQ